MQMLREDLTFALRQIRRGKSIAAAVVLMMALGIGANTAIFGLLKATFDEPPFPEMERLVRLRAVPPDGAESVPAMSLPEYAALQEQTRSFEALGAMDGSVLTLGAAENGLPAERVVGQRFKASLFHTLGVPPLVGRTFLPEEDQGGSLVPIAVISHQLWESRFRASPDAVGSTMLLDNVATTIVGVMPVDFGLLEDVDVWIPQTYNPVQLQGWTRVLTVVARLRRGVSLQEAQSEINAIAAGLAEAHPDQLAGWGMLLEPLDAAYYGETRQALFILQVAVGLILLIACANVAGLLLVQGSTRQREVGTRWALGAGRFQLLRPFVAESLVLTAAGGAIGLGVAWAGVRLITAMRPAWLSRVEGASIDGPFLLFAIGTSVLTGIVCGLVPALQFSKQGSTVLHEFSHGATGSRARRHMHGALVAAQVALTVVLLIGAGLVIQSFVRLQRADLGADPSDVLSFETALSRPLYLKQTGVRVSGGAQVAVSPVTAQTFEKVARRLQEVPGIVSAAGIAIAPFNGAAEVPLVVPGRAVAEPGALMIAHHLVTPDFFGTMRIPILRGRDFTYRDTFDAPWVAVINDTMAKRFWPNGDALGQLLTLDVVPDERPREIVGIVGDTPPNRFERTPAPTVYVHQAQQLPLYRTPYAGLRLQMTFVMRIDQAPDVVMPAVRRAVAEVNPAMPVAQIEMMEQRLAQQIETPRFYMVALAALGGLAVILAIFGIYGAIAYSVSQRAREFAIRVAFGARPLTVVGLVLRQAVILTAIGVTSGIVVSFVVTRYLASVLWSVTPTDPATFICVAVLFTAVAISAGLVPTYRALRLEPRTVLAET